MKQSVLLIAVAFLIMPAGLVTLGVVSLNRPLGPGPIPRSGRYAVSAAGWADVHQWRWGATTLNMYAMPVGRGPCRCIPVARIVQIGPVTITH